MNGIKKSLFLKRVFAWIMTLVLAGYAIVFMGLSSPAIGKLASQTCFAGAGQITVVPYKNVSPQKLKNVADAVAVTEALLAETGFALSEPVKVVVTENETDYAGVIREYSGLSPEKAAEKAKLSTGISLPQKPVIILQGITRLEKYPVTAYIMLPHEIFHQAQKYDGIAARNTRAWFYEGSAEAFRYLALERAGFYKKGDSAKDTFNRLVINYKYNRQKELPPLSSLASYDSWEASLKEESQSGSPLTTVYPYAALATLRLTGGDFLKIAGVHRLMRQGKTFDTAFQEVFDESVSRFEEELTGSLNKEIKEFVAANYPGGTSAETGPILIPLKEVSGQIEAKAEILTGDYAVEIAFSPDGKFLASGSAENIILWDLATGAKINTLTVKTKFHFEPEFAFSPDGKILACAMGREIFNLWDIAANQKNTLYKASGIFDVAFSPDGKTVAHGSNQGVLLWDVQTGKKIKTFGDRTFAVARFGLDGNVLAGVSESGDFVIWDIKTGDKLRTFLLQAGGVSVGDIAVSPDFKTLAFKGPGKSVVLSDLSTGKQIRVVELTDSVSDLSFSPDGKMLAVAAGRAFVLLDLETNESFGNSEGYWHSVAFSPDGRFLVTGSSGAGGEVNYRKAILWDTQFFGIQRKFKKDEFETAKEYEARMNRVEVPYSTLIALRKEQYNADRGGFEIDFQGYKLFIPVERERAEELAARKTGEVKLVGKLKYYDPENLTLVEGWIVDSVSQERYAIHEITPATKK